MDKIEAKYIAAEKSFREGSVWTESNEKLLEHVEGLASQLNMNPQTQSSNVIKALALNQILTKRLIESIDKKNAIATRWFMILAIGSLFIGTTSLFWQISKDIQERQETDQSELAVLKPAIQESLPVSAKEEKKDEQKPTQKDLNK